MPTGAFNGIVVIDADNSTAMAFVEARAPTTWTVRTKRGMYYYFRHPGFVVKCSAGEVAPGVDIRGDGGMVLCAGSENKSWLQGRGPHDLPLADLPEFFRDHPALQHHQRTTLSPTEPKPYSGRTTAWARAAFDGEIARVAHAAKGTWNDTLWRSAKNLGEIIGGGGLDESEVRTALGRRLCPLGR